MVQKTHVCLNNPENLSTTKVIKHTACGYAFSAKFSFHVKNINLIYKVVKTVRNFFANTYKGISWRLLIMKKRLPLKKLYD